MNHSIAKMLLALGCAGTLAATADAQILTTYSSGDYLAGFRLVGGTNSVVVDIGPITSLTSRQTFTLNLGATLSAQYGAGWASNANVYFSLASTDSADRTSYVTSPEYLSGPNAGPATVWPRLTNSNAIGFQNKINSLGAEYTSTGQIEPKTDLNAYQNYMPGGTTDAGHATAANISWGYFNPETEGNFSQTTAGVALDLIQLVPGSGPGSDLGYFQLSGDGNTLTYTPGAIPEPSTYALVGALALLGFLVHKTRKSSVKQQAA